MRRMVNSMLRYSGQEVRNVDSPMRSYARGMAHLAGFVKPASVIDIGVATGTPPLYDTFPNLPYLLVEANPDFQEAIDEICRKTGWKAEYVFCGESAGQADFNIYADPFKSSRFQIARDLARQRQVVVPVVPLDVLVNKHALPEPYLIKIDVEGAELDVIRGATKTLEQSCAVVIEASFLPRFSGASDFAELVSVMSDRGFVVFDIIAGAFDQRLKRLQQADIVFVPRHAAFRAMR